eukprot:scaffold165993_cov20-Tisochrysis_lutea.AAC.4
MRRRQRASQRPGRAFSMGLVHLGGVKRKGARTHTHTHTRRKGFLQPSFRCASSTGSILGSAKCSCMKKSKKSTYVERAPAFHRQ